MEVEEKDLSLGKGVEENKRKKRISMIYSCVVGKGEISAWGCEVKKRKNGVCVCVCVCVYVMEKSLPVGKNRKE